MKKYILLFVLTFCSCLMGIAQNVGFTWGFLGNISAKHSGLTPINLEANVGYNLLPKFGLAARVETNVSVFEEKTYITPAYGAFMKYDIFSFTGGTVDVRAGLGANATKSDWKYMYIDGGIFLKAGKECTKPTIGIGCRFYKSRNDIYKNNTFIYISLGFTVN